MKKFSFSLNHKIIAGGAEPASPDGLSDFLASVRRQTAEIRTPVIKTPAHQGRTPATVRTDAFRSFLAEFKASAEHFAQATSRLTAISKSTNAQKEAAVVKMNALQSELAATQATSASMITAQEKDKKERLSKFKTAAGLLMQGIEKEKSEKAGLLAKNRAAHQLVIATEAKLIQEREKIKAIVQDIRDIKTLFADKAAEVTNLYVALDGCEEHPSRNTLDSSPSAPSLNRVSIRRKLDPSIFEKFGGPHQPPSPILTRNIKPIDESSVPGANSSIVAGAGASAPLPSEKQPSKAEKALAKRLAQKKS